MCVPCAQAWCVRARARKRACPWVFVCARVWCVRARASAPAKENQRKRSFAKQQSVCNGQRFQRPPPQTQTQMQVDICLQSHARARVWCAHLVRNDARLPRREVHVTAVGEAKRDERHHVGEALWVLALLRSLQLLEQLEAPRHLVLWRRRCGRERMRGLGWGGGDAQAVSEQGRSPKRQPMRKNRGCADDARDLWGNNGVARQGV
jgi:hypothetical protein